MVATYDWHSCLSSRDIQAGYNTFLQSVHELISHFVPSKAVIVSSRDPPFVTPLVKSLLKSGAYSAWGVALVKPMLSQPRLICWFRIYVASSWLNLQMHHQKSSGLLLAKTRVNRRVVVILRSCSITVMLLITSWLLYALIHCILSNMFRFCS